MDRDKVIEVLEIELAQYKLTKDVEYRSHEQIKAITQAISMIKEREILVSDLCDIVKLLGGDSSITHSYNDIEILIKELQAENGELRKENERIKNLSECRTIMQGAVGEVMEENDLLQRELTELKANIKQTHKDYGCELRDPCGTIWEQCDRVQKENAELKAKYEEVEKDFSKIGSTRECGHFVSDIMSFCPVCRELADLKKAVASEEGDE